MINDFQGNVIQLDKRGKEYPVDVLLTEQDGKNILLVSARIFFVPFRIPIGVKIQPWKDNILKGFRQWAGHYQVFGGQQLEVRMDIKEVDSYDDAVLVWTADPDLEQVVLDTISKEVDFWLDGNKTFTDVGARDELDWKPHLPKSIHFARWTLNQPNLVTKIAKHEFGHVLGIGSVYRDIRKGMKGLCINRDEFQDLKGNYLGYHKFNCVMESGGPVSNNDIEMLILAFVTEEYQQYQLVRGRGKVSEAVGKGN